MDIGLTLTAQMSMVMAVLALTVFLFVFEIVRIDVAAISIMVLLGLTGLVPSDRLFEGFASNAVISIIAVMIIGAGLDRTGVMGIIANFIIKLGGKSESKIMALISSTVGITSGFMQNVGACALFLPVVSKIAARASLKVNQLLMPMGFCAILGGTLTMVGSSPLILLNDLIETSNRSLPPGASTLKTFSLFSVTPIGLSLLTAGILYFLMAGRFVLPKASNQSSSLGNTENYFTANYGIKGDIHEVLVTVDSPLVGMSVGETEAILGAPRVIAIRSGEKNARLSPAADEMIWVGTTLGAMGSRKEIEEWCEQQQLRLQPGRRTFGKLVNPLRAGISELVIPPASKHIGKSIGDQHFRKRYGFSVLAINRGDGIIRDDVRKVALQTGDSLVIHSTWKDLAAGNQDRDFVVVTDYPREEQRPHKVAHALVFFLIAMGMIIFTDYRLSIALMVGAIGMIISGVLSIDEAYRSVSWKTVFLLASLIPLGYAMEISGAAAWMAQEIVALLGDVPSWVLQATLALLATFLSLVMSNVGATTLLVPIAINIALATNNNPAVYALITALSTSNAFLIPTHQVNALIMGPGNYRVVDFMRAGSLMSIVFLVVMITSVNLLF